MAPPSEKRTASSESHGSWLVNVADDVVVPMTTLELIDSLRKGRLSEHSLVWRIGMHDWSAVQDVPQLRLAAGFTSVPSIAAPLTMEPARSAIPSTLAPMTAEAETVDQVRSPEAWGNIDELLENERRADQRSSRRVVLGAALGSAGLAAVFTVYLLRSPTPLRAPEAERPAAATEPSTTTAPTPSPSPSLTPTPTPETSAAPSTSVELRPPEVPSAAAKSAPPRFAKRPKRPGAPATTSNAPAATAQAPTTDAVPGAPEVPIVSAAPSAQP